MNETLGMWWTKLLLPLGVGLISAVFAWGFGTLDEMEDKMSVDYADLKESMIILRSELQLNEQERKANQRLSQEYLEVLRDLTAGVQKNSEEISVLEAQVNAVVIRNNQLIEAFIKESQYAREAVLKQ